MITDPIENVKSFEELSELLENEHDREEYNRLVKVASQSKNRNQRNMARIKLFHKFGQGDCPCSNCSQ